MSETMNNSFGAWLQAEIDKRGWTKSMLARNAKVSPAAISDVISGRRNIGPELARSIAKALKMEQEAVFRIAGIMDSNGVSLRETKSNADIDLIMSHVKDLDQHDRDAVLEFIHMLDRLRPKRKK
jgi:plasmid maintenance system antidote protein VapI